MNNTPWSADELDLLGRLTDAEFHAAHPHRSPDAIRFKRRRAEGGGRAHPPPPVFPDKKVGDFNWREANHLIAKMQEVRSRASFSQDRANPRFELGEPLAAIFLSDTHILSWGTDHDLLARITDEILSLPNLYVVLMGDLAQMSIKLRSVIEVSDNMLPPELQEAYVASWLDEIAPRVLCATWGNHEVERQETLSGSSRFKDLYNRRFVYHNGIGHVDLGVDDQTYRIALSHHFQGRSIYSPVHGAHRYLVMQGHDREIAACGDSHVPGMLCFTHGEVEKLALNAGSLQTNSGYAKRYFSLTTHPIFPVVVFDNEDHAFTPYWSIRHWLRSR